MEYFLSFARIRCLLLQKTDAVLGAPASKSLRDIVIFGFLPAEFRLIQNPAARS
jgi:hypothetical protein